MKSHGLSQNIHFHTTQFSFLLYFSCYIIIASFLPYYFTVSYYISFSYIISSINLLFFHLIHKSPYYFNITLLLCNILYLVTIHFIGSSFKLLCNSALLCHSSI